MFVSIRPQADVLNSELNELSERYSQKCLELKSTEQNSNSRETELNNKKKEMEQLQRENQVAGNEILFRSPKIGSHY